LFFGQAELILDELPPKANEDLQKQIAFARFDLASTSQVNP
jgi:hypothetical protein